MSVSVNTKGNWQISEGHTTTLGSATTSHALRQMQKQILEMAIRALDDVPVEKRDQSAITMAVDSARLAQAKIRVKNFRRELCSYLEGGKKKDSVYQLSISLFPVTQDFKVK